VALRSLELDPASHPARLNLAMAYGQKGMYREAVSELKRLRERDPEGRAGRAALEALAITYALAGRRGEAEKTLREVLGTVKGGGVSAYNVALIYAALGRKEEAFAWLEKAAAEMRGQSLAFMYDPHLDPLRSDPSFKAFVLRHRIPPTALTRGGTEAGEFRLCESGLFALCPKTARLLADVRQSP
jgi:tetratricopeptide (TPR) repeat protein